MSWHVKVTGTKEAIRELVAKRFDEQARCYEGKAEADDVRAARDRVLVALDGMVVDGSDGVKWEAPQRWGVSVEASGSNTAGSYLSMTLKVERVVLAI